MKSKKQTILERTKGGLLYFLLIYKLHGITLKRVGNKLLNTHNLFYFDSNPSFSIYYNDKYERWFFKDHGTNDEGIDYSGDVFEFARLYHKLKKEQFNHLLYRMDIDLTINESLPLISKNANYKHIKVEAKSHKYELLKIECTEECIAYYKQYNIDLRHYPNVHQIAGIRFLNEDRSINYTKMLPSDNIHIAYDFVTYAKIYSINPKGFRFVGKKQEQYTFGSFDYAEYLNKPLFLTGGEKDVMTLHSLGFSAICLLSEITTNISRSLLKSAYETGHQIIVLYDIDKAGRQSAKRLHNKYDFPIANLGTILPEYVDNVTDVSDYVRQGLDKTKLIEFLNSFKPEIKYKLYGGLLFDAEIYDVENI